MKCCLCERDMVESGFCQFHFLAYKNVVQQYEIWRKALDIPRKDYLRKIAMNSVTGDWAREVANYLSKKEETKDVRQI